MYLLSKYTSVPRSDSTSLFRWDRVSKLGLSTKLQRCRQPNKNVLLPNPKLLRLDHNLKQLYAGPADLPDQHARKAANMPRWIRRVYITIADFVLPRSLRAASGSSVGRNAKQLHNESVKSGECCKSNKSSESVKSNQRTGICHRNRDSVCSNRHHCAYNECGHKPINDQHVEGCICSICRDFNDYNATSSSTKRQNASSGLRNSIEFRYSQRSSNATETDIEYITAIPAGTTI
jgi:hypothetical protein